MRNAEYDRFGPWIFEISKKDPPPPLFRPLLKRLDESLLSIKIPRPIERRNAAPGMNLYDYMICMYEDDFDILRREDTVVLTDNFSYDDISCLKNKEILLNGVLSLYCNNSIYEFSYNTVSSNIIQRMVELIRTRYTDQKKTITVQKISPSKEELDFYFINLVEQEEKLNPDNRLFAFQPRLNMSKLQENRLTKFFNLISSKQLLESLHFCDGRELKIINRGKNFKYFAQPLYGKEDCFIPLKNLREILIESKDGSQALSNLRLKTEGSGFSYYFSEDNPTMENYKTLQRQ